MNNTPLSLKRSSALLFQGAIVLIGIAALTFLLGEPHIEGRNAQATTFEIYFKDPFLAYAYVGSIPVFVALYHAFGLFGHVRQTGTFSQATVDALRTIQYCAIAIIGFVAVGVGFILRFGDQDDRPAGVFMSLLVTLAASVIATAAARFARSLQNALGPSEGPRG
jgi:hypothetical protein